jgi:hypothetical protein
MGYPDETASKITDCMSIMYIGNLLEKRFAAAFTFYYANHTAFLTEELDTWYHGGISDMANQVEWKWEQLVKILDGKVPLVEM